jgi:hypothetical protein
VGHGLSFFQAAYLPVAQAWDVLLADAPFLAKQPDGLAVSASILSISAR